jgi:hypothetical protein
LFSGFIAQDLLEVVCHDTCGGLVDKLVSTQSQLILIVRASLLLCANIEFACCSVCSSGCDRYCFTWIQIDGVIDRVIVPQFQICTRPISYTNNRDGAKRLIEGFLIQCSSHYGWIGSGGVLGHMHLTSMEEL